MVCVHVDAADTNAVRDGMIVRLGKLRSGSRTEVAVARRVDERRSHERLTPSAVLGDNTFDCVAVPDRVNHESVETQIDPGVR